MDSTYTVIKVNEPSNDPSGPCYVTAVSNPLGLSSTLCYPNPFTERLTVIINIAGMEGTLRLSDMKGTVIADQKLEKTSNVLNTALLPPGIYVVEILTEHSVVTKQVIKLP